MSKPNVRPHQGYRQGGFHLMVLQRDEYMRLMGETLNTLEHDPQGFNQRLKATVQSLSQIDMSDEEHRDTFELSHFFLMILTPGQEPNPTQGLILDALLRVAYQMGIRHEHQRAKGGNHGDN